MPSSSPVSEQAVHEAAGVADALSGAFGHPVRVKTRADSSLHAFIAADELVSCGLVVTESVTGAPAVLAGNAKAVENAERRIAKRAGDGYTATLRTFDPTTRLCSFEVQRGGA